jgi:hypothetical protein
MRGKNKRGQSKKTYRCLDCFEGINQGKCPYCQGTGQVPSKPSRQWLKALKKRVENER